MIRWLFIILFFFTAPLTLLQFVEGDVVMGLVGIVLMAATCFLIDYWGSHP